MELNRDFREFFASLERHSVRYLLIGGYAMAAHGHPRFTKDLDVWIWMDPVNSRAIVDALDSFGFGSLGIAESDFLTADTVIQLGYPPQRIDLLTSPSGVTFDECWADRMTIDVDGVHVPVIGIRALIANKTAAGRDQDIVDARVLQRMLQRDD